MKILNKFIKISGLAAICGLFGLGCLTNNEDHTNTYEVSAIDNTLIFTTSGSNASFSFGNASNITSTFRNINYELNVNNIYGENYSFLYTISITFSGINDIEYNYAVPGGEDEERIAYPIFTSGYDTRIQSFSSNIAYDNINMVLDSTYCRYSSISGYTLEFNFDMNCYSDGVLADTYPTTFSYSYVSISDNRFSVDNFIYSNCNDLLGSFSIDSDSLTDYAQGFSDGYNSGYTNGYNDGNAQGYSNGYSVGYSEGVESQQQNITDAYNNGYSTGYNEGFSTDSTATTIFSGILQVALVPINFFLACFNFDILGINLAAFIKALFTIAITIIVIKAVMGGKGASE